MPVLKLTEDVIRGLRCPADKNRVEYCDRDLAGFYFETRPKSEGQGTYYWRYKDATGKTCHQRIGKSTEITLAEARKRAKELRAEIELGADPRGEAKAAKAVMTLSEFFDMHYLIYVKPRKRSWQRDVELFVRWRRDFGNKRLNEITRQQIQTFHSKVLAEPLSPASADHHVKLIRHAFNLAVEWGFLETNPARGVKLFNVDNQVENLLSDAELGRLMGVLNTHPNRMVCLIIVWLLSTGCRLNEALQATWTQIDRANRVWRISAATSKSKRIHSVPLNDSALEVLGQLQTEGKYENVFVNRKTGKPYTTVMKVWGRLRILAKLPNYRLHDCRHQMASLLVNSGRSLYEVQNILGHSNPKVTQRYSHLSSKALQEASNTASVAIKAASALAVETQLEVMPGTSVGLTGGVEPETPESRRAA